LKKPLPIPEHLKPTKAAFVGPELSMKINKLLVNEGDVVTKGQLLAVMDNTKLKQAEAQFDMAKKNYDRMKSLKNAGSVDKQTFDQIESAFKTAQSAYEFVKNNTQIVAPLDGTVTLRTKQEVNLILQCSQVPMEILPFSELLTSMF